MEANRNNSFGLLRYYAVICVMYLHFTGYMRIYVPDKFADISILRSVVDFYQPTVIMFAISGFLISASLERSCQDVKLFLTKRFLRIYPDLWISMIVYMVVLSMIIPEMIDGSVIPWSFVQGIGFACTPPCLKDFSTGSINGSLWFITVLIQLYMMILLFKRVTKYSSSVYLHTIVCAFLIVVNYLSLLVSRSAGVINAKIIERCFGPYAIWFFVGVFFQACNLYDNRKIRSCIPLLIVIHAFIRISGLGDVGYYTGIITGIITSILTIMIACSITKFKVKMDVSYGIYLYHWLFLNLMIYYKIYEKIDWLLCLLIYTVSTLLFAYVFRWEFISHLNVVSYKKKRLNYH